MATPKAKPQIKWDLYNRSHMPYSLMVGEERLLTEQEVTLINEYLEVTAKAANALSALFDEARKRFRR